MLVFPRLHFRPGSSWCQYHCFLFWLQRRPRAFSCSRWGFVFPLTHTQDPQSSTTSINELEMKCRELRQLQALIDEAQAEAETIKDAIKAAMGTQEAVQAGEYKITWKPVTTARLDATALKKALPDVAARFTKETTVRRFSVA